ncbi:MAG TPA: acyl-CoA dehydrogenase family protein [Pseudomonadales bacterium]|nr:acyl-CoA dehydrogenase family protein [Pseudomonadales bacterium]
MTELPTLSAMLAAITRLEPLLRAQMPAGRRAARLPAPVVEQLLRLGLFRLWIPRRYGGLEMSLPAALAIHEAVAQLDGSTGWAVMIGSGGGLFAAWLAPPVAGRLFGAADALVAGSGAPNGSAARVPGGFRVTGRWRYASGADHASVFTANCRVTEPGSNPAPLIRAMAFAPADVKIHRTWDSSGLRATGSHDIEVRDVFVPEEMSFSVFTDPVLENGPLYRLAFATLTELPVSAVALGIARRACEEFAALAGSKCAPGSTVALLGLDLVQAALHRARDVVANAAREQHAQAAEVWEEALAGIRPAPHVGAARTVACVRRVRGLVTAVGDLVPLAGMNALQREDPFALAWQDLNAAAAHYSVSPLQLAEQDGRDIAARGRSYDLPVASSPLASCDAPSPTGNGAAAARPPDSGE